LKGHPKKNDTTRVKWTDDLIENFEKMRNSFIKYTLLHYPRNEVPLYLTCDASSVAVGAVLEQLNEQGDREPLGFYSHKLTESQGQWPPYDQELYAVYMAIQHFEHMLEGRDFTIVTDHKALTHLFTTKKRGKIERRSRFAEYIAQFSTNIVHIAGSSNLVADAMSRPQIDLIVNVDHFVIANEQKDDAEIQKLRAEKTDHFREIFVNNQDALLCAGERPVIPKKLRYSVFKQVHDLAHPGIKATLRLVKQRYYWPKMTADVRRYSRSCPDCQKTKVYRHVKIPVQSFPASERFEHIHIDMVGPLKPSNGYIYACSMIDRAAN
jgi:cleavage and polyadenylation specificity factor subunit 1